MSIGTAVLEDRASVSLIHVTAQHGAGKVWRSNFRLNY
jgi:hypothetical protein